MHAGNRSERKGAPAMKEEMRRKRKEENYMY